MNYTVIPEYKKTVQDDILLWTIIMSVQNIPSQQCHPWNSSFLGTGKMAQGLTALAALPEDPDSITNTHMAVSHCLTPVLGVLTSSHRYTSR